MIKIYVPTSALTNSQWIYNGVSVSGNWSSVPAGSLACYGGVVTADYRYDRNIVGVSGAKGNKQSYTFVPFIIKNEFPAPHTYCYGVGYSSIFTSPSTQPTGSGFNMSNDATKDASNSATHFDSYDQSKFGVYFLGMGSGNANVWNLNSSLWVNSNALESTSGKLYLPPNILIRANEWHQGNSLGTVALSRTDPSLGNYTMKTWNETGVIDASGTIAPSGGQEIHLHRDCFIYGFMYFYVNDNGTTNEAATDYFCPTLISGYPSTSNFTVNSHGKWVEPELSGQAFKTDKTVYWDSNVVIPTRECRVGLYFAGRRIN